jgi:uncharacterized protein involved in outer membrane biogenesis
MGRLSTVSPGKRWGVIIGGLVVALLIGVLVCEALGWPFLVGPLQHKLASTLDRNIDFGSGSRAVQIRLLGSIRIRTARVEIGAPSWSRTAHTFLAEGVTLKLTYADLWHVYRTGALRIDDLEADRFDTQLERLADGRASWEFKPHQPSANGSVTDLPTFGRLRVGVGSLVLLDGKTPMDLDMAYSLSDGTAARGAPLAGASSAAPLTAPDGTTHGLQLTASGHYKKSPLKLAAQTDGVLILEGGDGAAGRQPLRLNAAIGTAAMTFVGSVTDPLHLTGLQGSFTVAGPSLDAAGEPLGVTLPVTPNFNLTGSLVKAGSTWKVVFDQADIGSSRLRGAFVFDKRNQVPLLSGKLEGTHLALADLGPAIGHARHAVGATSAPTQGLPGRLIPDHTFDLPSLRVMNANVLFDIADLDLGTTMLEPLRPARAHLTLNGGVLTLDDLDARTAQGELSGMASLDGRSSSAVWITNLRLRNLQLSQWLHQKRGEGDPPYISGKLDGQVKVKGTGRSVAEILGGLGGGARFHMSDAALSHLALKAAGLDVAGGLKVLLKGDEALPVRCNVADLTLTKGVIRPRVFVVSLDNATIWADGQVSLADETLNVRAVSSPKDFSPLSLRTPIDVKGTLAKPTVSIEASGPMARGGAALLLGLLNPLAALVPFLDPGARDAAKKEDSDCAALVRKAGLH